MDHSSQAIEQSVWPDCKPDPGKKQLLRELFLFIAKARLWPKGEAQRSYRRLFPRPRALVQALWTREIEPIALITLLTALHGDRVTH